MRKTKLRLAGATDVPRVDALRSVRFLDESRGRVRSLDAADGPEGERSIGRRVQPDPRASGTRGRCVGSLAAVALRRRERIWYDIRSPSSRPPTGEPRPVMIPLPLVTD